MDDGTDVKKLSDEATHFFEIGKFQDAVKKCEEVLIIEPANYVILTNKGIAQMKLRDYLGAKNSFNEALSHNPNYSLALLNLGDLFFKLKKYDDSLNYYEEVLKEEPENIEAINGIAMSKFHMGQIQDAKKELKVKALGFDELNELTLFNLGNIFFKSKQYGKSLEYFKKSLRWMDKFSPKKSIITIKMAVSYALIGNNQDAIKCFDEVVSENPEDVITLILKAYVFELMKKRDKSITQIDDTLDIMMENL